MDVDPIEARFEEHLARMDAELEGVTPVTPDPDEPLPF